MAGNFVAKPSNGWYCRVDQETGVLEDPKVREKDTLLKEFWDPIFEQTNFKEYIKSHYTIGLKSMLGEDIDVFSGVQSETTNV